jgi:hypothetical protein
MVEVKLSLSTPRNDMEGVGAELHSFLTLALDVGELLYAPAATFWGQYPRYPGGLQHPSGLFNEEKDMLHSWEWNPGSFGL